jgi:hypothetical protein
VEDIGNSPIRPKHMSYAVVFAVSPFELAV